MNNMLTLFKHPLFRAALVLLTIIGLWIYSLLSQQPTPPPERTSSIIFPTLERVEFLEDLPLQSLPKNQYTIQEITTSEEIAKRFAQEFNLPPNDRGDGVIQWNTDQTYPRILALSGKQYSLLLSEAQLTSATTPLPEELIVPLTESALSTYNLLPDNPALGYQLEIEYLETESTSLSNLSPSIRVAVQLTLESVPVIMNPGQIGNIILFFNNSANTTSPTSIIFGDLPTQIAVKKNILPQTQTEIASSILSNQYLAEGVGFTFLDERVRPVSQYQINSASPVMFATENKTILAPFWRLSASGIIDGELIYTQQILVDGEQQP